MSSRPPRPTSDVPGRSAGTSKSGTGNRGTSNPGNSGTPRPGTSRSAGTEPRPATPRATARPTPSNGDRPSRDMSRPLPARLSWTTLIVFAVALAAASVIVPLPWWVAAAYGALSVITFVAYALDKRAARRNTRRTPESTILTLGLIGGWPGAVVAQQLLRHKTRKRTFRRAFWATVALNVAAVCAIIWLLPRA